LVEMPPFRFASFPIANQVFLQSSLSLGLVNLKPLVPGRTYVLVIPKRVVPRFGDLTPDELTDLFKSVQIIGRVIEKEYAAGALTIACQDGPLAGQTVPHTHIHILPRKKDDFTPKDAIYTELEKNDHSQRDFWDHVKVGHAEGQAGVKMDADENRIPRSRQEMREEAERLSLLFPVELRGVFED
ncbi:HIT-like protein, partial [Meredithblackwellia eburnea MCA 4105]